MRKPLMPKLNGVRVKPGQVLSGSEKNILYSALRERALARHNAAYYLSDNRLPCIYDPSHIYGVNKSIIVHKPLPEGFKEEPTDPIWWPIHYHPTPCCSYKGDEVVLCLRRYKGSRWIIEYHKVGECPGKIRR